MNNIFEYKGYHTKIEFDSKDLTLRGKIEGINDLVNFESDSLPNIEKEFHMAVDEYLEFCKEVGKEPDKEYKGTFNVRISPELHKKLALISLKNGDSLNASVEKAIREYTSDTHATEKDLHDKMKILANALNTTSIYRYSQTPISYDNKFQHYLNVDVKYSEEIYN